MVYYVGVVQGLFLPVFVGLDVSPHTKRISFCSGKVKDFRASSPWLQDKSPRTQNLSYTRLKLLISVSLHVIV